MHRNFRKPLIVFTPKSLLRHKLAVSPLATWPRAARFQFVIPEIDDIAPPEQVRRVMICSGKVYYDLLPERRAKDIKDVAIVRLEQIYPFPEITVGRVLGPIPERRCGLVPGRAGEHGRLELRRSADREGAAPPRHEGSPPGLCRARRGGEPGDRPRQDPYGPAGARW